MSILTANLRHLYQRRGMWLVYVFVGFVVLLSIVSPLEHPGPRSGRHIGLVMLASIIGFLVTMSHIEVLSKPFSYCLPGHRAIARRFLFSIAVPVAILSSLVFLIYPGIPSWYLAVVLSAAFGAALSFFWLAVALAFSTRNGGTLVGLIPLMYFFGVFFDGHVLLERVIVERPLLPVLAGVFSSIAAWLRLGRADRARRYCAAPVMGFLDSLSREKVQRYAKARAAARWDRLKTHPHPWVETLFLSRIGKCSCRKNAKYVWGRLYTTFGMMLSQWPNVFVLILMVVLFGGYVGPRMYFMFFIMPLAVLPVMRSPLYSSMLIAGGRKQRFYATLIATLLIAALAAGFMVLVTGLSHLLTPIMPTFTIRGLSLAFRPIDIRLFIAPLLVLPVMLTFHVVLYKKPARMIILTMTLFSLVMMAMAWQRELAAMVTPGSALAVLALAWIVFVLVLRHLSARCCLVGP